jgi:hypothetical protein
MPEEDEDTTEVNKAEVNKAEVNKAEVNKAEVVERMAFVTHHQLTEVAQPGEEPLDLPPLGGATCP